MYLRIIQKNLFVLFAIFVVSKPDSKIQPDSSVRNYSINNLMQWELDDENPNL